jgi:hypothetical protein
MSGCPISGSGSPARLAATVAPTSGQIGIRSRPMREKGWSREFDDQIELPRGRKLLTLKDAADCIMRLPKAEQNLKWRTATEALILAAEGRGPVMHARIGVLRALHRNVDRLFNPEGQAEAEA